ncbi:hypothetical protein ACJX0J_023016, partial [Zea mays]
ILAPGSMFNSKDMLSLVKCRCGITLDLDTRGIMLEMWAKNTLDVWWRTRCFATHCSYVYRKNWMILKIEPLSVGHTTEEQIAGIKTTSWNYPQSAIICTQHCMDNDSFLALGANGVSIVYLLLFGTVQFMLGMLFLIMYSTIYNYQYEGTKHICNLYKNVWILIDVIRERERERTVLNNVVHFMMMGLGFRATQQIPIIFQTHTKKSNIKNYFIHQLVILQKEGEIPLPIANTIVSFLICYICHFVVIDIFFIGTHNHAICCTIFFFLQKMQIIDINYFCKGHAVGQQSLHMNEIKKPHVGFTLKL